MALGGDCMHLGFGGDTARATGTGAGTPVWSTPSFSDVDE